jgi:hypothetical protein
MTFPYDLSVRILSMCFSELFLLKKVSLRKPRDFLPDNLKLLIAVLIAFYDLIDFVII